MRPCRRVQQAHISLRTGGILQGFLYRKLVQSVASRSCFEVREHHVVDLVAFFVQMPPVLVVQVAVFVEPFFVRDFTVCDRGKRVFLLQSIFVGYKHLDTLGHGNEVVRVGSMSVDRNGVSEHILVHGAKRGGCFLWRFGLWLRGARTGARRSEWFRRNLCSCHSQVFCAHPPAHATFLVFVLVLVPHLGKLVSGAVALRTFNYGDICVVSNGNIVCNVGVHVYFGTFAKQSSRFVVRIDVDGLCR